MSVLKSPEKKTSKLFICLISPFLGITTVMLSCQPLLRVSVNYTNGMNAVNVV